MNVKDSKKDNKKDSKFEKKIMNKQNNKNNKNNKIEKNLTVELVKGILIAFSITAIIFIGYGILITYTDLSYSNLLNNLPTVALVTTAISTAVMGFDWAMQLKLTGLYTGVIAGISYIVLLFIITFLANGTFEFGFSKLVTIIVAILSGGIGGIFGANGLSKK